MHAKQQHAHSKVELKISCENLPYSSTQVLLLAKDSQTSQWESTPYKTEVISNSSNPEFVTGIVVDYTFEVLQQFRFTCINVKSNNSNWRTQKVIGYYDCDLGSIVASRGGKLREKLYLENSYDKTHGLIAISAEEVEESKRNVKLQIQAHNIKKTAGFFFFKSIKKIPRAFFVLSRANEDMTFSPVYGSQPISSVNPLWPEFDIKESTLCNCDLDRALQLQIKNDKNGDHLLLGQCTVTLRELLEAESKSFQLKLPPYSKQKNPRNSKLTFNQVSLKEVPTFLDYIAGGTQINLVIAIDFTHSNGDPKMQDSLHYIGDKNSENDYQQAIRSVGTILEKYDSDKKIPVYGFGGRFNGNLSHCYPLNDNFEDPEVDGIDGVMEAYKKTINNVELYGPTNFTPIIKHTSAAIRESIKAGKDEYYILLIVTDGVITDMDTTIRAIVRARKLPLSIVIVGVGDDDFKNMKILDADENPLTMNANLSNDTTLIVGKDIVQFVAMREFKTNSARDYFLPKAVMEEIPDQFMSYMKENNIKPKLHDLKQVKRNPGSADYYK